MAISILGDNRDIHLALVAIAVTILVAVYNVSNRPLSHLPGPWYSKWTGLVARYHWLRGRKAKYVHQMHQAHGPIVRVDPNEVSVTDLAAVRQIYSTRETFVKAPFYRKLSVDDTESVFSTTNVDLHRRHRRLLSNPLSESSLKNVETVVQNLARLAIQRMEEEMHQRGAVDIFKWFLYTTSDVIGELTFGESFQMLERREKSKYFIDIEASGAAGALRAIFPWLANTASRYISIPWISAAQQSAVRVLGYAVEMIARQQQQVRENPGKAKPTLFDKLLAAGRHAASGGVEETLAFKEIRDNASLYIVAGADTTGVTLTYLVWRVCRSPAVRDALAAEVAALPDDFADRELRSLRLLHMVVDETLRLHSAVPSMLPRVVPAGGAELAGQLLPAGTIIGTQAYSMHRDPAVFPQPEEFIPWRWEAPTKEMKDSFMPWGGGSRVCLGLHLARMELRLLTALFFRSFPNAKPSNREDMTEEDMDPKLFFLLSPRGGRCLVEAW